MFQCVSLLFIQQLLALGAYATRFEALLAQPTPYIPGYALESPPAPSPTTPPRIRVLRQLARRDDATCGYYSDDGSPNVCGASQYCTTTASGNYGVWNCCNPDSCFLEPTCVDFDTCPNQYCVTSYMYDAETWYSRFMCGDSGGTTYLFYNFDDTPAYTQSVDNQQAASSAAAQSQADESASEAAAAASASDLAISASNAAAVSSPAWMIHVRQKDLLY
ncbi:hypothetical protein K491DRAFT_691971 [Lophiostoma macrostomum CBS 122681]|uniref:Uncharacterized protein n=1 Tax=Lophiostoma macrostomum CBS 122681 TaxID=1314788 RepID=A0A6A6T9T9_9PLEO|nr:hypothetical protein K491DRAFT_691971 [Lophiostoma macrostomum CBS 122681]